MVWVKCPSIWAAVFSSMFWYSLPPRNTSTLHLLSPKPSKEAAEVLGFGVGGFGADVIFMAEV
jgi:hypothetical protein